MKKYLNWAFATLACCSALTGFANDEVLNDGKPRKDKNTKVAVVPAEEEKVSSEQTTQEVAQEDTAQEQETEVTE
ncbi:MAG: hypothetical protein L0207_06985 [Chlamydiae bacterium]|nr:hypothetical protein [Chlamydiota bacterium]